MSAEMKGKKYVYDQKTGKMVPWKDPNVIEILHGPWEEPDYEKMTSEQLMWDTFILQGCLEMRKKHPEMYSK